MMLDPDIREILEAVANTPWEHHELYYSSWRRCHYCNTEPPRDHTRSCVSKKAAELIAREDSE